MGVRRIDPEKCTGCKLCLLQCPMDVFRMDTERHERNEIPACQIACPAGVDMRGYIYLITQRRYQEAIARIREFLPIPSVTGRICTRPCERACFRRDVDAPVNIKGLERFIADRGIEEKVSLIPKVYRDKIAVVGSGPAGLAAAYWLVRMGYPVTVFEAKSRVGGMLRMAVPEFLLPENILDRELRRLEAMGVQFETRTTIGKDLTIDAMRRMGYRAFFLAPGAQVCRKLEVSGSGLRGVLDGLDLLKSTRLGRYSKIDGRVVVIGGGMVALAAALTALRLGARKVGVYYRGTRREMRAASDLADRADREGIEFHFSVSPVRILGKDGKVSGVEFMRTDVGEINRRGGFGAAPIDETNLLVRADRVIVAIGREVERSIMKGLEFDSDGRILVEPSTGSTSVRGVFAGGDAVSGARSTVHSIASGRRAALQIDRYLRGVDVGTGEQCKTKRVENPPKDGVERRPRLNMAMRSSRRPDFSEIVLGFSEEEALLESERCMSCGSKAVINYIRDCQSCALCEAECPVGAITCFPSFERRIVTAWE